ncbi:hypothetical protein LTR37_017208 [Vermiconidia calcicola]|uniref:Uncharacterized protein n=1 Tax=Vermiconidia calcicola TaxID=1690605 RepID=A0ACC3MKL4_9PEZI|nr:hypothetical protein LTR37_017208 [Vermiconidia calcicola]
MDLEDELLQVTTNRKQQDTFSAPQQCYDNNTPDTIFYSATVTTLAASTGAAALRGAHQAEDETTAKAEEACEAGASYPVSRPPHGSRLRAVAGLRPLMDDAESPHRRPKRCEVSLSLLLWALILRARLFARISTTSASSSFRDNLESSSASTAAFNTGSASTSASSSASTK